MGDLLPSAAEQAHFRREFARAPVSSLIELVCRLGYAARGAVYVSVGLIALLAAFDSTPRAENPLGALEAWADWPFGGFLLWVIAIGLYGFALWRLLQSAFDADRQGRGLKALANRLGQAISGIVYGALGWSLFQLLDALEDFGEVDDRAATRQTISELLAAPGGELILLALGLFTAGVGVGNIVQGFTRNFCRRMTCDRRTATWVSLLGRAGYIGRGLAFLPAGVLAIRAAARARAGDQGLGAALDLLERQPFGSWLLALTALGLVAFGLFAFAEARYRSMSVEQAAPGR